MYHWGQTVTPKGFGLVKADKVTDTDTGIGYISSKSRISDVCPGKSLVGFIHGDGKTSVLRLNTSERGEAGKLKTLDLKKDKIRLISCAETDALLLAFGGKVLSLDKSNVVRRIKELNSKRVIQVACGDQHFMALSNDGQMFTWGQNSSGQLGLGRHVMHSLSPQPLPSLCGIPLTQISAGGDHSFVLSLSGAVLGWGRNSAGQLGLGHTQDMYIPTCVNNLSQKKVVFISCGEEHTATLSKGGTVFTFGSGQHGQLGHNSVQDELRPRVVSLLWGLNVSQIACGRHHTLALAESSNTIYSFGRGEHGQLENGKRTNQNVPLPVQLLQEASNVHTFGRIIAGGNWSFAMCSSQKSEPHLNRKKEIVTLGTQMFNRWINGCESNQWKTTKKEIKQVFSSPACINGSFIIKSCDGHYQTSTHFSGLDLDSVRSAFEQLAMKEQVLREVMKVVENDLLPSLIFTAAGVETLRVFLILSELLRVLNQSGHATKIAASYASAILKLDSRMQTVLDNYLCELPEPFLGPLVKLFQTLSAKMISNMTYVSMQANDMYTSLRNSVQVLQMLHKASCRNQTNLTPGDFIVYEINELLDMCDAQTDFLNIYSPESLVIQNHLKRTLQILISSPCIFAMEAKCRLLRFRESRGLFRLALRRTALLEDSFLQLKDATNDQLKGWLQVVYCENLEQSDVHKRDFFHNAFKTLLDPQSEMFMYNDTKTLTWFPVEPSLPEERYFFLGLLCGLAFYNNSVVHIRFPLALFKKLLDITPSLEDLTELSPVEGRCLRYVLDYSDADADNMNMIYTILWNNKEVELDPNEAGKAVTSSNKNEFVDRFVDYVLNESVERTFNEFKRGFYKVCDREMVKLFQPEELRGVMIGSEEYDWDVFRKNAVYEYEFHKNHTTIILFWEVFEELLDQDKKGFLLFLTGFDRVPILGMETVRMRVRPLFNSTQDHLPQALTCHSILDLPIYRGKEILRTKLVEAIHFRRGFWED